jgi:hypothetical protein
MNPAPSLSTTDAGPPRSVEPVFGALATERDARFFQPDMIARQSNRKSASFTAHQISEISSKGASATKASSAAKAYQQAEMLTLQHVETASVIL